MPQITTTLYNYILRIARNLLETRENIKIEFHLFYHIICDWFVTDKAFFKLFFFASFSWKSVQICMVEWIGWNFDVFPGFQQIPCYA